MDYNQKKDAAKKAFQDKLDNSGKYICNKTSDELNKCQKQKTLFMFLSTLFFAFFLIQPATAVNAKLKEILPLSTLYVGIIIFVICISVYVSYQNYKKHKLTGDISALYSPRGGFDKRTFTSFEVFNITHILLVPLQIGLVIWSFDIWGLVSIIALSVSAVFSFISRQILFNAYAHSMTYLEPKNVILSAAPDVEVDNADNAKSNENVEKSKDGKTEK